jgi:hypothetical protein
LITNRDIWDTPGGAVFQWTYYSVGAAGKIALKFYFYIGALIIASDIVWTISRNKLSQDDFTVFAYLTWIAIIYTGMSANTAKSLTQGSYFYFPFLLAMTSAVGRMAMRLARPGSKIPSGVLVSLLAFSCLFLPPTMTYQDARSRPETLHMLSQISDVVSNQSAAKSCGGAAKIYTTVGPYPVTPDAVALRLAQRGIEIQIMPVFLMRDKDEVFGHVAASDFVLLPNKAGMKEAQDARLPGIAYADQIVQALRADQKWLEYEIDAQDAPILFVRKVC